MVSSPHKTVDCRGLHCPQPVLRCLAGFRALRRGETLHLIASDTGSHPELLRLIARAGHALLEHRSEGGLLHYLVRIEQGTAALHGRHYEEPGLFSWRPQSDLPGLLTA